MNHEELIEEILKTVSDIKAENIVKIDLTNKSSYTECIIICHGTSTAHAQGISEKVYYNLKKQKILPLGLEGQNSGEWILMDYNSVVLHVFQADIRNEYRIEELYETL